MKPSSCSTFRTFTFRREAGISIDFLPTVFALRKYVSRSATGSVIMAFCFPSGWVSDGVGAGSPGGLAHARDLAEQRAGAQADAADAEFLVDGARAPAHAAARVRPDLELRRTTAFHDPGGLGHCVG